MLEVFTSDIMTELGGADGSGRIEMIRCNCYLVRCTSTYSSPTSSVTPITGSLTALPAALVAVTVIV